VVSFPFPEKQPLPLNKHAVKPLQAFLFPPSRSGLHQVSVNESIFQELSDSGRCGAAPIFLKALLQLLLSILGEAKCR